MEGWGGSGPSPPRLSQFRFYLSPPGPCGGLPRGTLPGPCCGSEKYAGGRTSRALGALPPRLAPVVASMQRSVHIPSMEASASRSCGEHPICRMSYWNEYEQFYNIAVWAYSACVHTSTREGGPTPHRAISPDAQKQLTDSQASYHFVYLQPSSASLHVCREDGAEAPTT